MTAKHLQKALRKSWRIWAALLGGFASSLAYPREGLWPFMFISLALLLVSVWRLRVWAALGVGFIGGLAFYLSQIEWLSLYLGPVPWLALSTLEALWFALGMAAIARVWVWAVDRRFGPIMTGAAVATIWFTREWLSSNLPYGGFPWSRVGQAFTDSNLANWVYLAGIGGLSWVVVAATASVVFIAVEREYRTLFKWRWTGPAILVVAMMAVPLVLHPSATPTAGELRVAAVQGNANAGLFANPRRGSILENHLEATKLVENLPVAEKPDVVVWPENASDLNPLASADARAQISELVDERLGVPLIFGTITQRDTEIFNSSLLWLPETGPTDFYDKKRPVPFAEYVPDYDFWYQLAPDLIGLVGSRGYSAGSEDGIFRVANEKLGVLICFEIAVDEISRELVRDGASIILSQTNNADFGRSDESFQQAAIARLRAIETGRTVVNVSTVGLSEIYLPDGSVIASVPTFKAAAMIETLPLRTEITPAMEHGSLIDLSLNMGSAALVGYLMFLRVTRRKPEATENDE